VGGAEVEGRLLLELHRIDGDDVLRPGHVCALHGVHAHPSQADDDHDIALGDLGPYTAEPQPVVTPHETRATTGRGYSWPTFTSDASWTTP